MFVPNVLVPDTVSSLSAPLSSGSSSALRSSMGAVWPRNRWHNSSFQWVIFRHSRWWAKVTFLVSAVFVTREITWCCL